METIIGIGIASFMIGIKLFIGLVIALLIQLISYQVFNFNIYKKLESIFLGKEGR